MRDALEAVVVRIAGLHHHLHKFIPAGNRAARQTTGEDFGHGTEVRHEPQLFLQTPRAPAKPGDNFVQNHHHTVLLREIPYPFQEAGFERHGAVRGPRPFGDDTGDIIIAR